MRKHINTTNFGSAIALAMSLAMAQPAAAQDESTQSDDQAPIPVEVPARDIEVSDEIFALAAEPRPIVAMGGPLASYGQNAAAAGGVNPLKGRIRIFTDDLGPHIGYISSLAGPIDPSKGRIRIFENDIDPYKGRIRIFWGDLTPVTGELDPKIIQINSFTESFLPTSEAIIASWTAAQTSGNFSDVIAKLNQLLAASKQQWEDDVAAQTGKDFTTTVANPFLAKWNVNLANPSTLAGLDAFDRSMFLLDWYDTVMNFSGMDRYDHWMNAVRWTPALTQVQGGGSKAVIGLVDFFAANDADVRSKVIYSGGYQNVDNAHGAAVGSLIVASHDGRGVMGIAPRAQIAAFNPFDHTFTASWRDVERGIAEVGQRGASVINLSLGVPGFTLPAEWRNVFRRSEIDGFKDNTIYVIAAGNDGSTQRANIEMNGALDSTFLIVGSVDPFGQISSFSNRPGTACITDGGVCKNTSAWNPNDPYFQTADYLKESGLLMNRFLVAPGELLLVSDGKGGVTRMSGTSFAAPLVSGAIALIQDRWPWLKNYPRDVAKIILESAQDLGAPGVDPIYGHGLLDIAAAQSALDFSKLKYYLVDRGQMTEISASTLQSSGVNPIWSSQNLYFSAFEKIDSAERDFLIPLSSRLFGGNVDGRMFQKHMYDLFMAWVSNGGAASGGKFVSLTDTPSVNLGGVGGAWSIAMRGGFRTVDTRFGFNTRMTSSIRVTAPDDKVSFAFGFGESAAALAGNGAMQLASDFDPLTGGNDPLLGFASGQSHMAVSYKLARNLTVGVGFADEFRDIDAEFGFLRQSPELIEQQRMLGDYAASAINVRVDYAFSGSTNVGLSLTQLDEENALLGVRSLVRDDFGGGGVSRSATLSADTLIGETFQLFGSATVAQSQTGTHASLRLENVTSTAWQAGFAKQKLLGSRDNLRFSIAQPLQVERGVLEFQSVGVVNRETGERGIITQRADIAQPETRRFRAEAHYGAPIMKGSGQVAMFSSYELRDVRQDIARWTVGGRVSLAF
jgi:subtilisin family serine protease